MAVTLETHTKRFIGHSTDERPELSEVDAGSSFYVEDTRQVERWNGKAWVQSPFDQSGADAAATIALQVRTNELLELILERL